MLNTVLRQRCNKSDLVKLKDTLLKNKSIKNVLGKTINAKKRRCRIFPGYLPSTSNFLALIVRQILFCHGTLEENQF